MTSRQSGWHRPDSWGVGVSWLRHRTEQLCGRSFPLRGEGSPAGGQGPPLLRTGFPPCANGRVTGAEYTAGLRRPAGSQTLLNSQQASLCWGSPVPLAQTLFTCHFHHQGPEGIFPNLA